MTEAILTINAGSSSIKFAVFAIGCAAILPEPLAEGQCDGIGSAPRLRIDVAKSRDHAIDEKLPKGADHRSVLSRILTWIEKEADGITITAAGHRVVHGGPDHHRPELITSDLIEVLNALTPLAPLHQPHNLAPVRALARDYPHLQQIACYDTGFHAANPWIATTFALPRALSAEGVRRYGFHGLSYEYIASVMDKFLGETAKGRVVVAHLGNGASMCALQDGRSITSTMGFSALDGLIMGTRTGSIDPGVLLYLMKEKNMDYDRLTDLLYHQSGLLGVSGISNDMRTLLASDAAEAREAVDLFNYCIARQLGSLAAALGGLDALIFTGGIGEHAAAVRTAVCEQSAWLGIEADPEANAGHGPRISSNTSKVSVFVIPTNEDLMIARHSLAVIQAVNEGKRSN